MTRAALLYVLALVAANQLLWVLGPSSSPYIGAALIGLDLSLRDRLHDRVGPRIVLALVLLASTLSWLLNPASGAIALGSVAAFALAGAADTLVYQLLRNRPVQFRMNGSNLAGALVDSLVFPVIAFGGFVPDIFALQFVAKVVGGASWAYLLTRKARA